MNFFKTKHTLFAVAVCTLLATSSCNKELESIQEIPAPQPTGQTLDKVLEGNPDDTMFLAIVNRAGLLPLLKDSSKNYTLFVPVNAGIKKAISQLTQGAVPEAAPDAVFFQFINNRLGRDTAAGIVLYHIIPQKLMSSQIGTDFPNKMLPTLLNPRPDTSLLIGPVIRLAGFPTTRNGGWYNNVPIVGVDQSAYNGVIHHIATVAMPPSRTLWDRISEDAELTYLKAAILRADSGYNATNGSLQAYLKGFGANFTIFAPVDTAFRKTITALIYNAIRDTSLAFDTVKYNLAVDWADSSDVFNNQLLFSTFTAQTVRAVVAYHVLANKAYTNNFSTTEEKILTLLNASIAEHGGLKIKATYTNGVPFPISVSVKDVYNNSPDAKIIMSAPLTPEPFGKSDQNYTNGVLHKIDQVLLPL